MNILVGCIFYKNLSGTEMYFYELTRELVNQGHNVTLISQIEDSQIAVRSAEHGVKILDMTDPNLPDESEFDVACFSHYPIFDNVMCMQYPNLPKLMICHSEVIPLEVPIKHPAIKHYVGIRQTICDIICRMMDVKDDMVTLIKNPIDFSRFNMSLSRPTPQPPDKRAVLFVGSFDYLRTKSIMHLYNLSKEQDFDVVLVGRNDFPEHINEEELPGVKIYPPCWDVEKYLKDVDGVAGVFMGRTTLEGWCAGKTSLQYIVNKAGDITDFDVEKPPEDMSEFDSVSVTKRIAEKLESICK